MLLAFDTATAGCAVCVWRAGETLAEERPTPDRLFTQPAHTRELLPAVDRALTGAGATFADLEAVAVGVGPGAFTGLRIGVATARALASALGVPLYPVSSLAALALGAADGEGATVPVLDARRKEFFCGAYLPGGAAAADRVCSAESVTELVGEAVATSGSALAVGDGAILLREQLVAGGATVPPATDTRHTVGAAEIARLASGTVAVPVRAVTPNYIREPDAKASSRRRWLGVQPAGDAA